MRRFFAVWACGLALMFAVAPAAARAQGGKGTALRVSCDRETALYAVGEKATFLIRSTDDGEATYRVSNDGFKTLAQGKMKLAKGKTYSVYESHSNAVVGALTYRGYGLDYDWEVETGPWTMEIWHDGRKLAEKTFMVTRLVSSTE